MRCVTVRIWHFSLIEPATLVLVVQAVVEFVVPTGPFRSTENRAESGVQADTS